MSLPRTRVISKIHEETGTNILVTLKKKTVMVEGTRNGVDIAIIKLKREKGWRDRFNAIILTEDNRVQKQIR
tara:strand:- start:102 stop:317 length:216 start_codon:yes stop_codon:yes gene_type:complete